MRIVWQSYAPWFYHWKELEAVFTASSLKLRTISFVENEALV